MVELSFTKNQVLILTNKAVSEGWWEAQADGKKGLVPSNYKFFIFLNEGFLNHNFFLSKKDNFVAEFEDCLYQCKALFDYAAQTDEELALEKDCIITILDKSMDPDWWRGFIFFPQNLIHFFFFN